MDIELLRLEFMKLKRSKIVFPIIILPLISVFYGSINYWMNTGLLRREWISLWTQVYFFYGLFFLPAIIGIICSYLWSDEHKNKLKVLLNTTIPFTKIILAKMIAGFMLIIVIQVYLVILFSIAGFKFHFKSTYPYELLKYIVLITILTFSLLSIQAYLSLKIKYFAPPVVVSIIISIVSIIATNNQFIPQIKYFFGNTLLTIEMNHYPQITLNIRSLIILSIINLLISIIFIELQKIAINKKLR